MLVNPASSLAIWRRWPEIISKYNRTYSGTLQDGIPSPILANIRLNELDKKVTDIKESFDKPRSAELTEAYHAQTLIIKRIESRLRYEHDEQRRKELIDNLKACKKDLLKIPSKPQDNKRLVYVRYADDWLIGICGNKMDCEAVKTQISAYLGEMLKQSSQSSVSPVFFHKEQGAKRQQHACRMPFDEADNGAADFPGRDRCFFSRLFRLFRGLPRLFLVMPTFSCST